MTINGESAVELDYATLHPTLLYHLHGFDFTVDFDPYTPQGVSPKHRSVYKSAVQMLLNAKSQKDAVSALNKAIRDEVLSGNSSLLSGLSADGILKAVMDHNAPIKRFFFNSPWTWLQRLDSDLTEDILLNVRAPVVPIHDSYLVPESAEAELYAAMVAAYQRHTKTSFVPKIKRIAPITGRKRIASKEDYEQKEVLGGTG